jgi:hypothetical protein
MGQGIIFSSLKSLKSVAEKGFSHSAFPAAAFMARAPGLLSGHELSIAAR